MSRDTAAFKLLVRTTLACGLCLLAFVFAIEAKTAWYGSAAGPGSAVRAAKALPASLPREVQHGSATTGPIHSQLPFVLFAAFLVASLAGSDLLTRRTVPLASARISSAAYFSPQSFFRPPPFHS